MNERISQILRPNTATTLLFQSLQLMGRRVVMDGRARHDLRVAASPAPLRA